jgi:hypothetical protein
MKTSNSSNKLTDTASHPSAYKLISVELSTASGRILDIMPLVTALKITESIYMFSLLLEIDIRDTVNLFEEVRISGQEKLKVTLSRKVAGGKSDKISKTFYVSEIPTYGKTADHVQAYIIKGVSEHAFVNSVSTISRSTKGSLVKEIQNIVKRDLRYDGIVETEADSKGNVRAIIPTMKPFTAITWLLRRSYNEGASPVFAYETLEGFNIKSYHALAKAAPLEGTYKLNFLQKANPNSTEGYDEMRYKIISMASNINNSKYLASMKGAYASTTRVLDIATKRYYDVKFDYINKHSSMPTVDSKNKLLSGSFSIKEQSLNHHHDSIYIYLNENSKAHESYQNYHYPAIQSIGTNLSILENLDTIKHEIQLYGDVNINPGKKMRITAPKSIDPQVFKNIKEKQAKKSIMEDMMVSGTYLITSVVHRFSDKYTCDVALKKDDSYYNLDEKN